MTGRNTALEMGHTARTTPGNTRHNLSTSLLVHFDGEDARGGQFAGRNDLHRRVAHARAVLPREGGAQ